MSIGFCVYLQFFWKFNDLFTQNMFKVWLSCRNWNGTLAPLSDYTSAVLSCGTFHAVIQQLDGRKIQHLQSKVSLNIAHAVFSEENNGFYNRF